MTFSLKVAAQNLGDAPDVLVMVIAGELGRRGQAEEAGAG